MLGLEVNPALKRSTLPALVALGIATNLQNILKEELAVRGEPRHGKEGKKDHNSDKTG